MFAAGMLSAGEKWTVLAPPDATARPTDYESVKGNGGGPGWRGAPTPASRPLAIAKSLGWGCTVLKDFFIGRLVGWRNGHWWRWERSQRVPRFSWGARC